jgi:hypothetical protein
MNLGTVFNRPRARKDHDWQALGSAGSTWLTEHGCTNGTVDQCRGVGYSLMIYELTNASPTRITRATVNVANREVESVVEDDYPKRLAKWKKDRDDWIKTEILKQHGLKVIPKPAPVEQELTLTEERDRVFAKVKGKELREHSERPAPPGHKWVLEREKAKPRGKGFVKGFDPRRWTGNSSK